MTLSSDSADGLARFDRKFFESSDDFMTIGEGELGGKAGGLAFIDRVLKSRFPHSEFPGIAVNIPKLAVLTTDIFDSFMRRNRLYDIALSGLPDDRIARAFIQAEFPAEYVGDLMALISSVTRPLAVRSSSLLEDALRRPFAGVYATKMTPNNQFDPETRFNKLLEAIKLVYASTFFKEAKDYIQTTREEITNEKMAVIIQEVVGGRFGSRFYPVISGVGKSFSYYAFGKAEPTDGAVNLALGLGRTIVDGGTTWRYSPAFPKSAPPYGSVNELLKMTQVEFWAVNMTDAPYHPLSETEYEVKGKLSEAENDGNLNFIASTYRAASDKIYPGIGSDGPRLLNFAPILVYRQIPLNDVIRRLLEISRDSVRMEVEIEFAVTLDSQKGLPARVGFLQVRPMVSSEEKVEIDQSYLNSPEAIVVSDSVMGNGLREDIHNVIYVKPEVFNAKYTGIIAGEINVRIGG